MTRSVSSAVVVLLVAFGATPALSQEEREFIGLTRESVETNLGIGGMHAACTMEFPGARMCSSADIVRNGEASEPRLNGGTFGWVHPSNVVFTPDGDFGSGNHALDTVSGVFRPESQLSALSCGQWRITSDLGRAMTYDTQARTLSALPCVVTGPIACCAARRRNGISPPSAFGLRPR